MALKEALGTILSLRDENRRLRDELAAVRGEQVQLSLVHTEFDGNEPAVEQIDAHSPAELKVALFRGLFRGREDIYAVRWERPDGRGGYAPALRFGAPRGRGVAHDPSDYLSLTPAVVRSHLTGGLTIGIYPLLQDDTCWLLAIDFDKAGWRQDALAALEVCDGFGIPGALERSRSGEGAHLWVFFAKPVAAFLARNLGSAMLTQALDRRYQIGLDSYDRLFPSQDTLPKGGFGNLIALPLQRQSREQGNTVFLDRDLEPHRDQWRFLSSIRKLEPAVAESIVQRAARSGRITAVDSWVEPEDELEPWKLPPSRRKTDAPIPGPLPARLTMVLANRLFVDKKDLPPALINRLRRSAAFQNPEFYRAQRMRLSTFGKPRLIDCSEDFPDHLALQGAVCLMC